MTTGAPLKMGRSPEVDQTLRGSPGSERLIGGNCTSSRENTFARASSAASQRAEVPGLRERGRCGLAGAVVTVVVTADPVVVSIVSAFLSEVRAPGRATPAAGRRLSLKRCVPESAFLCNYRAFLPGPPLERGVMLMGWFPVRRVAWRYDIACQPSQRQLRQGCRRLLQREPLRGPARRLQPACSSCCVERAPPEEQLRSSGPWAARQSALSQIEQCLNRMQTMGLIHTLEQCHNRMQTVGLIHTLEQCHNRMQTVGLILTLE
ncbi:hypothetical protein AAFF_G00347290 [Aldrovandia affinis]|uniref:Uncharacterized protein n=1 Tax=Aldrovandia affinis TaxID=143900 RepID=A0AAD7SJP8_9TELE|nr:hypothetical protein AAFF_G00347290 [Aldrovandia affinis]